MNTYLYRAITTEPCTVSTVEWEGGFPVDDSYTEPAGAILGRQSGYLSRSAAVDAGRRSGLGFEIVRSEPVEFLTEAEQLQKRINELKLQYAQLVGEVA